MRTGPPPQQGRAPGPQTTSRRDRAGGSGAGRGDGSRAISTARSRSAAGLACKPKAEMWHEAPLIPLVPPLCLTGEASAPGGQGGCGTGTGGRGQRWQLVLSLAEGCQGQAGSEPGRGPAPRPPRGMLRGSEPLCGPGLSTSTRDTCERIPPGCRGAAGGERAQTDRRTDTRARRCGNAAL